MDKLYILRKRIDHVDEQIVELLGKRIEIMKAIGTVKKHMNTDIKDHEREKEKITLLEKKAQEFHVPLDIITKIWHIFFETSSEIEK